MTAIELLNQQHDEVDALFEMIERARGPARTRLFTQIADALAIHAAIEEKIFYPGVRSKSTDDLLLESVEEHLAIKRAISDLLELSPSDERFDARLSVLKERVQNHVKEERSELFPRVRKNLDKEQLKELGDEMDEMVAELEGTRPRLGIPSEIHKAAEIT